MSWTVEHGDNRVALAGMDADSIDAVVTDPPYELGFMGKRWDSTGIAYDVDFWREVYRVMKPGAHLVAFGSTRTYHRMACAIEDAGFEVRDSLHWVYTQGFPKSLDVSKAIDSAFGAERQIIGMKLGTRGADGTGHEHSMPGRMVGIKQTACQVPITAATTPEAQQWSGWGTALKPAHEPIVLARKPLAGTVAANVLQWGTGAVNVEGCRVATDDGFEDKWDKLVNCSSANVVLGALVGEGRKMVDLSANKPFGGRWPPNFILSHSPDCGTTCIPGCAVDEMERQSASSRMFPCFRYEPKPSRGEREAGCEALPLGRVAKLQGSDNDKQDLDPVSERFRTLPSANVHPTVKPIELMRWLCRLVTPPAGLVLDPFCGSGTTGCAAVQEGMEFIGLEREREYVDIAEARIAYWARQAGTVAKDAPAGAGQVQLALFGGKRDEG